MNRGPFFYENVAITMALGLIAVVIGILLYWIVRL